MDDMKTWLKHQKNTWSFLFWITPSEIQEKKCMKQYQNENVKVLRNKIYEKLMIKLKEKYLLEYYENSLQEDLTRRNPCLKSMTKPS